MAGELQRKRPKIIHQRIDPGKGADVVYDAVGGDAFDACARSMARNGRLLVVGFASGRIPELPVNLTLVKEFSVIGVFWVFCGQRAHGVSAKYAGALWVVSGGPGSVGDGRGVSAFPDGGCP